MERSRMKLFDEELSWIFGEWNTFQQDQAGCCTSPTHTEASGGFDLFEEVFHNKRVNGCWQGNSAQHADKCVTQTYLCAHVDGVSACRLFMGLVVMYAKMFWWRQSGYFEWVNWHLSKDLKYHWLSDAWSIQARFQSARPKSRGLHMVFLDLTNTFGCVPQQLSWKGFDLIFFFSEVFRDDSQK